MSLEQNAQTIESNLDNFVGLGAKICFDFADDGGLLIDATANPPTLSRETGTADCTIRISSENMSKLLDGSLNPMMAFTLGKLKIDGDMTIAMKIGQLLED